MFPMNFNIDSSELYFKIHVPYLLTVPTLVMLDALEIFLGYALYKFTFYLLTFTYSFLRIMSVMSDVIKL